MRRDCIVMDTKGLTDKEATYIRNYFIKTGVHTITKNQLEDLKRKANEKVPRRKLFI